MVSVYAVRTTLKKPVFKLLCWILFGLNVLLPSLKAEHNPFLQQGRRQYLLDHVQACADTIGVDVGEAAFLRAIRLEPNDPGLRLIFADWLHDNAQEERSEFTRLQVANEPVWTRIKHRYHRRMRFDAQKLEEEVKAKRLSKNEHQFLVREMELFEKNRQLWLPNPEKHTRRATRPLFYIFHWGLVEEVEFRGVSWAGPLTQRVLENKLAKLFGSLKSLRFAWATTRNHSFETLIRRLPLSLSLTTRTVVEHSNYRLELIPRPTIQTHPKHIGFWITATNTTRNDYRPDGLKRLIFGEFDSDGIGRRFYTSEASFGSVIMPKPRKDHTIRVMGLY